MKVLQRHTPGTSEVGTRRRTALLILAVTSLLIVPAAISWACGPNRAVQLDRFDYGPGQSVTVSGANWIEGVSVTITLDGAPVASTTTSSTGNFSASFPAPTAPGTYTVVADGVDPNTGQSLPGGNTRQTFTVTAPQSAPSPSADPPSEGAAPTPGAPAPAPGTSGGGGKPGNAGDDSRTGNGGERRRPAGGRERRANSGGGSAARGRPVNTAEGLIQTAGTKAFAGSVTRQARVNAATRRSSRSAKAGRPSERSAGADLWSGFASSKSPSLMPDAGNGVPTADKGSGLAVGLGLLGTGFLALLGLGLAEAERRRRRVTIAGNGSDR